MEELRRKLRPDSAATYAYGHVAPILQQPASLNSLFRRTRCERASVWMDGARQAWTAFPASARTSVRSFELALNCYENNDLAYSIQQAYSEDIGIRFVSTLECIPAVIYVYLHYRRAQRKGDRFMTGRLFRPLRKGEGELEAADRLNRTARPSAQCN